MYIKNCILFIIFLFGMLYAQAEELPSCSYIAKHPKLDGYCILIVGNDTTIGFSPDRFREHLAMKNSLDSARKVIKLKDSLLLEPLRNVVSYKDTVISDQKLLIEAQTSLINSYKEQIKLLSKLKPQRLSLEVGGGLTGKETNPILSLGLSYKRVKLMALGQKNNSGGMMILSVPLL